jgi:hypothetical protein
MRKQRVVCQPCQRLAVRDGVTEDEPRKQATANDTSQDGKVNFLRLRTVSVGGSTAPYTADPTYLWSPVMRNWLVGIGVGLVLMVASWALLVLLARWTMW